MPRRRLDGAQVFAIALRALFGRAHAGQHILFHQHVAIVTGRFEPAQHGRKIDHAFAQLAEDAVAQRFEIIPLLLARAPRHFGLAILQVDIPDAVAEAVERGGDFGASGAIGVMAGVEHQADVLRIGQIEKARNLLRRFHVAGAVVMKHGAQAGFGAHGAGEAVSALGEYVPPGGAQSHGGRDPPGVAGAFRDRAIVVGQNQVGFRMGSHRGQQARHAERVFDAGLVSLAIGQGDGHERTEHHQAAARQLRPEQGGIGGHVAPVAELGPGVAGFSQLVQHAGVAHRLSGKTFEFERAPGARRVANFQFGHVSRFGKNQLTTDGHG